MSRYSRTHLSDHALLRRTIADVRHESGAKAELLADLAEVDARKLYLPAACPSMYTWCLAELYFSEDAAYKRIQAARAASRFPAIFDAIADGRLHLSAVVMLAPRLTPANSEELIAAATDKTKAEIERMLAERFPRPDVPAMMRALVSAGTALVAAPSGEAIARQPDVSDVTAALQSDQPLSACQNNACEPRPQLAPEPVRSHISQHVTNDFEQLDAPRAKPMPLSPHRFALQFTIGQAAYDDLLAVQALLGHAVAPGDIAEVFGRAIQLLRRDLERRRCAATARPRTTAKRPASTNPRHVPAEVKRAVWRRDGGRCTFVSDKGRRCEARHGLELDHVTPVARGGTATVEGLRLRCRAHNQYAADQVFGRGFMDGKRRRAAERVRDAGSEPAIVASADTARPTPSADESRLRMPRRDSGTTRPPETIQ